MIQEIITDEEDDFTESIAEYVEEVGYHTATSQAHQIEAQRQFASTEGLE